MNYAGSKTMRSMLLALSCVGLLLATDTPTAFADGTTGGTIVVCKGSIGTSGDTTTITQTSNKLLINWDSFSIPAGSSVIFDQPGSLSIALNRVIGNDPSSIYGNLLANGRIWIINGNGILFGHGSMIDVGGLIATTADISDKNFKKGKFVFVPKLHRGGSGCCRRPAGIQARVHRSGALPETVGGSPVQQFWRMHFFNGSGDYRIAAAVTGSLPVGWASPSVTASATTMRSRPLVFARYSALSAALIISCAEVPWSG